MRRDCCAKRVSRLEQDAICLKVKFLDLFISQRHGVRAKFATIEAIVLNYIPPRILSAIES